MREGTFALGASAWLVGWSIFLGLMGANLMKAAQMPLELAAAHPVLTLDSSFAGAASADLVKINKLESLVGTKLACLTGRALKASWHATSAALSRLHINSTLSVTSSSWSSWSNRFYPGVPAGAAIEVWDIGFEAELTLPEPLDTFNGYAMTKRYEVAFNFVLDIARHVDCHGNGWELTFDSQSQEFGFVDLDGLEMVKLVLLVDSPVDHSLEGGLEFSNLHINRGSTSGFAWVVFDGFVISHDPVHDVQFEPSDCIILVHGGHEIDLSEEVPDIIASLVLIFESLEPLDGTLHA